MERLDQLARGLVVAGLDRVEHLVDEFRAQPVFLVDRRDARFARGRRRRCSRSRSCAHSLDWTARAALLWARLLWRKPAAAPKSRRLRTFHSRSLSNGRRRPPDPFTFPPAATSSSSSAPTSRPAMSSASPSSPNSGFYDGVVFHRVIPGFMAQGGDPTGTGTSGSDLPNLKAEFSSEPHVRGVCLDGPHARSRTAPTASSSSASTTPRFLDSQYTVWGEVESGMEHVDALPVGEPPREPGKIVKATITAARRRGRSRADHRRVGRARGRVRAAAARSAAIGWCWRRGARTGSTRWPKSSAMPAPSRSTSSKPDAAAKLMADVEASGEQVDIAGQQCRLRPDRPLRRARRRRASGR